MSGPKADEISPNERLAQFERDRARLLEIAAKCSQMRRRAASLSEQWQELEMGDFPGLDDPTAKMSELQRDLDMQQSARVVAEADQIGRRLEQSIKSIESSITIRKKKLEDQYSMASEGLRDAREGLAALSSLGSAFEAQGFDKSLAMARVSAFAAGHPLPEQPVFRFNRNSIRELAQFELKVSALTHELEQERRSLIAMLDELVTAQLIGDGSERSERQRQLAEVLARTQRPSAPAQERFDLDLDQKIHILKAQVELLPAGPAKEVLNQKLEAALVQKDEARKRDCWNAAQIEYSAAIKKENDLRLWMAQLDEIEQRLACESESEEVRLVLRRINELRRTMTGGSLADLQNQATAAVAIATRRRHFKQRQQAILDSLQELGYQVNINETAEVGNGQWIARQEADRDYVVAVNENPQFGILQLQVVRLSGATGYSSTETRRRDVERETAFCSDHARFLELMRRKGYEIRKIHHSSPGEHPMMEIAASGRAKTQIDRTTQARKMEQKESSS